MKNQSGCNLGVLDNRGLDIAGYGDTLPELIGNAERSEVVVICVGPGGNVSEIVVFEASDMEKADATTKFDEMKTKEGFRGWFVDNEDLVAAVH